MITADVDELICTVDTTGGQLSLTESMSLPYPYLTAFRIARVEIQVARERRARKDTLIKQAKRGT